MFPPSPIQFIHHHLRYRVMGVQSLLITVELKSSLYWIYKQLDAIIFSHMWSVVVRPISVYVWRRPSHPEVCFNSPALPTSQYSPESWPGEPQMGLRARWNTIVDETLCGQQQQQTWRGKERWYGGDTFTRKQLEDARTGDRLHWPEGFTELNSAVWDAFRWSKPAVGHEKEHKRHFSMPLHQCTLSLQCHRRTIKNLPNIGILGDTRTNWGTSLDRSFNCTCTVARCTRKRPGLNREANFRSQTSASRKLMKTVC